MIEIKAGGEKTTDLCPTQRATRSGIKMIENNSNFGYRIRKLTPKECWRLMGFDDESFNKAAYETKEFDVIDLFAKGAHKLRNVKLTDAIEKQSQKNMETYVLNITSVLQGMGITSTEWMKFLGEQEQEKDKNVNIVIEKLAETEHLECATSITKCLNSIMTLYGLMEELDRHHTAIIELGETGKQNTAKYMKITSVENLTPMKLFIILMVLKLTIESKIYTSMLQRVSIHGCIANLENCKNNMVKMQISDLKMVVTYTRVSSSQLYKQAGNSIVTDVLYYIFKELYNAMPYLFEDLKVSSYFSGIGAFEIALNKLFDDINSENF